MLNFLLVSTKRKQKQIELIRIYVHHTCYVSHVHQISTKRKKRKRKLFIQYIEYV